MVQVEVEVPGTPEEVWKAIASGPGIASWFVPPDFEERDGGLVVFHLSPGMDAPATITAWEPSRRLVYEERDWMPGAPPLASEWIIEARAGGSCVVRVVHSLFADRDDWDDQLGSMEKGWPGFFRILRLVLTHFRGRPVANLQASASVPADARGKAWQDLLDAIGLPGARPGQTACAVPGVPSLAGVVEHFESQESHSEVLLRLDAPTSGVGLINSYTWDERSHVSVSLYLFGEEATRVAAREEPLWRSWMSAKFAGGAEPPAGM
jgi:uncharacterized protein YndB with AHSA1/START domain